MDFICDDIMNEQHILITTSSFGTEGNTALEKIAAAGLKVKLNPYGRRLSEAEAAELLAVPGLVGMIAGVEPLTRNVLSAASGLKVISRCGIGMDSVDLVAAQEFGISVRNTPDAPAIAVAELTLGLMLAMLRRVAQADRKIRANAWQQIMGNLLAKQTVGVIGYGGIGRRVARLVHAFGAGVVVCDSKNIVPEAGVEVCDLDALLSGSDIVSLHLPYTQENHHLIDASALGKMKRGSLLLNTARGGLVDEDALVIALQSGHIAGAALDCFGSEPYTGPLAQLEQVLLTAHMGSYAQESRHLMEVEAAENLLQGLQSMGVIA
jgi:D-3-phosphoglycerate dehydrogenase